jgi:hypothetical protein
MSSDELRETLIANGFKWTAPLEEAARLYGVQVIKYRRFREVPDTMEFFSPPLIIHSKRAHGIYDDMRRFTGEEIAPIGTCERRHVDLMLTESGRLFGYADNLMLTWGPPHADWKVSLARLLAGEEAADRGLADPDEGEEPATWLRGQASG